MASYQVELASSPSSFGSVLKDHNHKERHREPKSNLTQKSQTNFQRNLKMLVRDHFHSCISISGKESNIEANENSCLQSTIFGCWGPKSNNHNHIHFEDVNTNQTLNNRGNDKYNEETTSSSYLMSKRQSQILDQCVVQQQEEMVTTIDTQSHGTKHMGLSKCHSFSSRASSSMRGPSPTSSNCSSTDLSVSSLVQIWKGFESETRHNQCNKNSGNMEGQNPCSNTNVTVENNKLIPNPSTYDSAILTTKDDVQGCTSNVKSSQHTSQRGEHHHQQEKQQLQQQHHHHDIACLKEEKRVNVVDMVKTWANTYQVKHDQGNQEQQVVSEVCFRQLRTRMDIREKSLISSPIISSSKLRGRQAIVDLFMRMERERYKEVESLTSRQAVTKFPQRGRIQSLLRLRILRREASIQDEQQPSSESNPRQSNQLQIIADVYNIRGRFCATINHDTINKMNSHKELTISIQETGNDIAFDQTFEQTRRQEENNVNSSLTNILESNQDGEITLSSNQVLFEEQTNVDRNNNSEQVDLHMIEEDQLLENSTTEEKNVPFNVQRQDTSYEGDSNLNRQHVTSKTVSCADSEEETDIIDEHESENNQQNFGANIDWIIDIARPRIYWEDCRKARYKDIFNTQSKDKDIRQLLERGNVSSILASNFRERMDRLMMCSIQRVMHSTNNEDEQTSSLNSYLEEEEEQDNQENIQVTSQNCHYGEENEEENVDRELNSSLQQYQDVSDYDQTPFSSQQLSPNHSYYCHNNEGSSSKNISTIDVELIYDLRTHMQQLYQEMFELRKSITSCMDMKVKLQTSIKEEVSAAIGKIDKDKQKNSNGSQRKMGNCHICYDRKIDSLLYRCGHMCTCFNCANELRWSSGKCPICRAQIIDVVRTYCDI